MQIERIPYYGQAIVEIVKQGGLSYPIQFPELRLAFEVGSAANILALYEVILERDYGKHGAEVEKKDKVIVDIGAGTGDFSLRASRLASANAHVYAFEPNIGQYSLLQKNVLRNQISNVSGYNQEVHSLRQVFDLLNVSTIDLLKLDCEGAEFSILNNISLLRKIKKLALETHDLEGKNTSQLQRNLEKAGFDVYLEGNRGVQGIGLLYAVR